MLTKELRRGICGLLMMNNKGEINITVFIHYICLYFPILHTARRKDSDLQENQWMLMPGLLQPLVWCIASHGGRVPGYMYGAYSPASVIIFLHGYLQAISHDIHRQCTHWETRRCTSSTNQDWQNVRTSAGFPICLVSRPLLNPPGLSILLSSILNKHDVMLARPQKECSRCPRLLHRLLLRWMSTGCHLTIESWSFPAITLVRGQERSSTMLFKNLLGEVPCNIRSASPVISVFD